MWQGVDEIKRRFAFGLDDALTSLNFAIVGLACLLQFLKVREDFPGGVPLSTPVLRQYATELKEMVIQLVGATLMGDEDFVVNRTSPLIHTVQGVLDEAMDVKSELQEILFSTNTWFRYLDDREAKLAEMVCRAAASSMTRFFQEFDEEYLLPEKIARCLNQVIEKMEAWKNEVAERNARKTDAKKRRRCFRRTFNKRRPCNSTGRTGTSDWVMTNYCFLVNFCILLNIMGINLVLNYNYPQISRAFDLCRGLCTVSWNLVICCPHSGESRRKTTRKNQTKDSSSSDWFQERSSDCLSNSVLIVWGSKKGSHWSKRIYNLKWYGAMPSLVHMWANEIIINVFFQVESRSGTGSILKLWSLHKQILSLDWHFPGWNFCPPLAQAVLTCKHAIYWIKYRYINPKNR